MTDISTETDADWFGYETRFGDHNAQVAISPGLRRKAAHSIIWKNKNNSQGWIGAGVDHLMDVPDGYASGGFNSTASSQWVFAGNHHDFQRFSLTAEVLFGATRLYPDHPEQSLLTEVDYRFDAARLGLEVPLGASSQIGVDLTLPPVLRDGQITLRLPIGVDLEQGQTRFQDVSENLSLTHRERRLGFTFTHQSTDTFSLYAAIRLSQNDGHQKGISRQSTAFGLRKRF